MVLRISSKLHQWLLAEAEASPDIEVCGLVIGADSIERLIAVKNVSDQPETSFEIDPVALFSAIRNERAGGERLLGYYHSHPAGPPKPSAHDVAQAANDDRIWLIIGEGVVNAWQFNNGNSFSALRLIIGD
jgi:desampylase